MSTMTRAAEGVRADLLPREPRCRICRDETLRILVNQLLDWRGVPLHLGGGKKHKITFADIARDLEPFNEGRDKRDWITYDSLWIHAKRHYGIDAMAVYWTDRIHKDLVNSLAGSKGAQDC